MSLAAVGIQVPATALSVHGIRRRETLTVRRGILSWWTGWRRRRVALARIDGVERDESELVLKLRSGAWVRLPMAPPDDASSRFLEVLRDQRRVAILAAADAEAGRASVEALRRRPASWQDAPDRRRP